MGPVNVDNFPNLKEKLQIGKFEVFGQAVTKFTFQSWGKISFRMKFDKRF